MNVNIEQYLAEAKRAQDSTNYDRAQALYKTVLAQLDAEAAVPAEKDLRLTALYELGQLQYKMGQQESALTSFQTYYQLAENTIHRIDALVQLGNQHCQMGQHLQAIDYHRQALQLAESENYTPGRAAAYGGLAIALNGLGRFDETIANLEKSIALFTQLKDNAEITRMSNRLGTTYLQQGHVDKAIQAFEKAVTRARDIGNWETSIILSNLGEAYQLLFDMEQALIYHEEALELAKNTQLFTNRADLYRNLGVDLIYVGDVERGINYLYRALSLSQETGLHEVKLQARYSLALAELQQNNLEVALEHITRLEALVQSENAQKHRVNALYLRGLYHQQQGSRAEAESAWQRAIFVAHETENRMLLWQLHAAMAEIATNPSLAAVHLNIAAEVIDQIAFPIENGRLRQKFLSAPVISNILSRVDSASVRAL